MKVQWTLKKYRDLLTSLTKKKSKSDSIFERNDYRVAYENESMAILYTLGKKDKCIVSFTGVGHALGGIDLQTPEFSRSEMDGTKVFVIDKYRSWGNSLDWISLKKCICDLAEGGEVITLGNSMGGFLALLSAKPLAASRALAFVPQWSVDSKIMPEERRWNEYRKNISVFKNPDLSNAFDCKSEFTVIFGDNSMDAYHMEKFPTGLKNLRVFQVHEGDHNVAKFLKEHDLLYPIISMTVAGRDPEALLEAAGVDFDIFSSEL